MISASYAKRLIHNNPNLKLLIEIQRILIFIIFKILNEASFSRKDVYEIFILFDTTVITHKFEN